MSSNKTLVFPAGRVIFFTSGEYSDYCIRGTVVTLKEVNILTLIEEFKNFHQPKHQYDYPHPDGFVTWLITSGYVFPADTEEVHLGSYGDLNA